MRHELTVISLCVWLGVATGCAHSAPSVATAEERVTPVVQELRRHSEQLNGEIGATIRALAVNFETPAFRKLLDARTHLGETATAYLRIAIQLLAEDDECGAKGRAHFAAAVRTLAAHVSNFAARDGAGGYVSHFAFAGHVPFYVPHQGGTLVVYVRARDPAARAALELSPASGQSEPVLGETTLVGSGVVEVHFVVDPSNIEALSGGCAPAAIQFGEDPPLRFIMCGPERPKLISMVGEATLLHVETTKRAGEWRNVYSTHNDCSTKEYDFVETWQIDNSCHIESVEMRVEAVSRGAARQPVAEIVGRDRIVVHGAITPACIRGPFSKQRLIEPAIASLSVRPIVSCAAGQHTIKAAPVLLDAWSTDPSACMAVGFPRGAQIQRAAVRLQGGQADEDAIIVLQIGGPPTVSVFQTAMLTLTADAREDELVFCARAVKSSTCGALRSEPKSDAQVSTPSE